MRKLNAKQRNKSKIEMNEKLWKYIEKLICKFVNFIKISSPNWGFMGGTLGNDSLKLNTWNDQQRNNIEHTYPPHRHTDRHRVNLSKIINTEMWDSMVIKYK